MPQTRRQTTRTHNWNPSSPNVRAALGSTVVKDAAGTIKTRSEITYDNPATTANPIETKAWDSTKGAVSNPLTTGTNGNSITTTAVYDQYGNPTLATDAKGNQTQITYGSVNGFTGLYPTQTVAAYGTPVARTSAAQYDFHTGLVTTATDVDNNVSVATEYDALGRPTKVRTAANTPLESWVQTSYDDVNRRVIVKADIDTIGDARKVATQFYDQLGRVRLAKTLEDASVQSATNETDGIKVQTRYKAAGTCSFDATKMCSSQVTSNPFRANYSSNAGSESTMGWTLSQARADGRYSEIQTFSSAELPPVFGGSNSNSTGVVKTSTDVNTTTVEDQVGKKRRSVKNALDQLIRIDEPNDAGLLDVNGIPVQSTYYSYDPLNNLTTVVQGIQTRTFGYSSLSRMITEINPESGTTTYEFDPNGNPTKKTDARGVSTHFTYDVLNRVMQKSYSGENGYLTPTVNYTYDEVANAKGRLTKVSSSISENRYTAFDKMGRVLSNQQVTDGQTYSMEYAYNLGGGLVEQTYPSGRKVKNVLDASGDLSIVQSKKNSNYGYFNYAKSFAYASSGSVTRMQLGNGQWQGFVYNSKLQAAQISHGTTSGATNLLQLDFNYGSSQNNGNLMSQTITVPSVGTNAGFTAVQNYSYDSLNRLKHATETISGNQTWKQTFTFDRFGNRNFDEANTTTLPKLCSGNTEVCSSDRKIYNPSINAANNRLSTTDNYSYDNAGNTINDAQARSFKYDAENKQYEVRDSQNQIIGQYYFDGNGKRVKKVVPSTGEVTIFVYDSNGRLSAEYSTNLSTTQQVSYVTADHLGSPRIKTDQNGAVIARNDYYPYGEDVSTANRTQALGYKSDDLRQKFTTYQRDNEANLDFAEARMYANPLGRFTTCDPIMVSKEHLANPQRWNAYIYVLNAPTVATDPDGKKPKREIDVFLTYENADTKRWKAIQQYAKKHGAKINIYTNDAGTATLEQFKKSIQTKDRTVIVVGHSYVPGADRVQAEQGKGTVAGKGVGIMFANNEAVASPTAESKGMMQNVPTLEGVEASAKNLVILTCDFGDTFSPLGSKNKTNFLWATGGEDGLTTTFGTVTKVARKMAEIFARGGSARQAQGAGSAILGRAPGNDGETMIREVLHPLEQPPEQ